jgi:hypothetical protein
MKNGPNVGPFSIEIWPVASDLTALWDSSCRYLSGQITLAEDQLVCAQELCRSSLKAASIQAFCSSSDIVSHSSGIVIALLDFSFATCSSGHDDLSLVKRE